MRAILKRVKPETKAKFMEWWRARPEKSKHQAVYGKKIEYALEEYEYLKKLRLVDRFFKKHQNEAGTISAEKFLRVLRETFPFHVVLGISDTLKTFFSGW